MIVLGDADGSADEDRADQQIARDLLGPRRRIVQHVARQELIEHGRTEQPEQAERDPALERRLGQVDGLVGGLEFAVVGEDLRAGVDVHDYLTAAMRS